MNSSISRSPRSLLVLLLTGHLALLSALALPATGEAGETYLANLRDAAGEAHFRTVERFPDREADDDIEEASDVDIPGIDAGGPLKAAVEATSRQEWGQALETLNDGDAAAYLDERPLARLYAGIVASRAGEHDQALDWLRGLDDDALYDLGDYRAFYAARSAMANDDHHVATVESARVSSDSRLHEPALYILAQALLEAGETEDKRRAQDVMETYLSSYDDSNDAPRVWMMLGRLLEEKGDYQAAARRYFELREKRPLRLEVHDANDRLDGLRDHLTQRQRQRLDHRTDDEIIERYVGLYNIHRSERVIDELSDLLDDFEEGSDHRCTALFKIAHSHTKLRRHSDGTPWYDRVIDECGHTDYEIRALYLGGRGRWNAGDRQGAMDTFERIWTDYEDHSFADDALYFTARILRSEDRYDEAREILNKQVERYPDGDMAKDAHWLLIREHFENDDLQAVVDYVDALEATGEDDLYTRGRLFYFRARALEMMGHDQARSAFVEVIDDHPKSYYALLAFNRLARLDDSANPASICQAAADVCDERLPAEGAADAVAIPSRLSDDPGFQRASALLSMGLNDHAQGEVGELRRQYSDQNDTLWALASLLDEAGAYPLSHNIARRHIDGWMDAYPERHNRTQWTIGYPAPFSEYVDRWAEERQLDAAFIYAIMREESGFNPHVESWANARGLLQLLDDTGQRMASQEGLSNFAPHRLYDPDTNIRLGSAYMDHLGQRLDHHPALIAAGYNGGHGNVRNWLNDADDLPFDLFVEDIPFGQTRRYVKRVLMSYWIYSYLHGDQRVPYVEFQLSP